MKATDEKWEIEYDGLPLVYTDNGLLVATMYDPEQAHLAASAPDLYRALEETQSLLASLMHDGAEWRSEIESQLDTNRTTLDKARGEV